MLNESRCITELFGGVGFNQTPQSKIDDGYPIVDEANLASLSGLKFQNASTFVTIQTIHDIQELKDISADDFNSYLKELQSDCILQILQSVFQGQSLFNESVNLYPFEKSYKNTIDPNNEFVGFYINKICYADNIKASISWIELMFDSDIEFPLYLYNSNKPNGAIKELLVTSKANESVIINLEGWDISDKDNYKGGAFYIGYFENDLNGAKAIKRDSGYSNYKISTNNYSINPVSLSHSGNIIDITTKTNKSDTQGINIGINTYSDYTELITRNKNVFWAAIQLEMGSKILKSISSSLRTNATTQISNENIEDIKFELYGNPTLNIEGVTQRLAIIIKDLQTFLFYKPRIVNVTRSFSKNRRRW